MSIENIKVPDLGDSSEVEVIELLVSVGQSVEENDSLLVLESDKAAMEIPAPMSGVVKSIAVNLGDQVTSGSEMLTLEVAGDESPESSKEADKEAPVDAEEEKVVEEDKADAEAKIEPGPDSVQSSITIDVPDLGTDDEVEVIEIHVKPGSEVALDEALITLESDKAAMDVPAPQAGTIESLLVAIGDKIKTGSPIAKMLSSVAAAPTQTEAKQASIPEPTPKPEASTVEATPSAAPVAQNVSQDQSKVYAGPAVRKLARELGVDLSAVPSSGAKSRIIKEDIHEFVKSRLNAPAGQVATVTSIPDIDFSQFGEIEQLSRSKLHKLTAVNMHRSWSTIPHVAQFNEADVTDLEEFRAELKPEAAKRGSKLTFMPFLLKACAKALQEYPQFNVSLHSSGETIIQKKYIHIGVAVATEAGLLVPVIKNVDQKTIWQLADEVIEISDKAKQRKLKPSDMQGGCFSISSLGAIGGTGFIPIINAPEVAILGVAKTQIKPVYIDGEFVPRKMLPFTLSYDHRAVNGVDGGQFATYLASVLADIRRLAL
ncbi:MAG: dihydrolipoamide acetyltransferase [SAR86 cluster bacterium]|uniref:Dihydrolipoamide acetyltransferase component of pyruvate dehydrogenase complex n=1 Tax=SAR86 cluster bacterium TaxID=2030880 RepID=A0A2A5AZD2_9GAMM|nr:MAG: dihydrolipoamide acetyltransferase [SAR86 cluster bacterium]